MYQEHPMKEKRENWWWAGDEIWDRWSPEIGLQAAGLLCFYCRAANKEGWSWYSINKLSKKLRVSTNTIRKYNRILMENGLIEWHKGGRGVRDTNKVKVNYRVQKMNTESNKYSVNELRDANIAHNGFKDCTQSTTHGVLQNKDLESINKFKMNTSINGYYTCSYGEYHADGEPCSCSDKVIQS